MPVVRDFTALLSGYSIHDSSGKGAFFTYSFPVVVPVYYTTADFSAAGLASFRPFTEAEKAAARQALDAWASISGLTFFEVPPGEGDIQFGAYDLEALGEDPDVVGFAFYPGGRYDDLLYSDIFLDWAWADDAATLIHEIGHAIGLKHPFEDEVTLASDLDNYRYTVMSYTSGGLSGTALGEFDPQAIQYLYGAASADGTQVVSWSWDPVSYTLTQTGGGWNDTILGVGTADIIAGLGLPDFIQGRGGNDQLNGGEGDDEILGGAGNDILTGELGADELDGGDGNDLIQGGADGDILYGGAGADRFVYSSLGDSTSADYDRLWDFETGVDKIDLGALAPTNVSWTEGTYSNSTDVYSFITVTTAGGTMTLLADGRVSMSDFILSPAPPAAIVGTAGNDVLQGTSSADIMRGEGGDDTLFALAGNDSLVGGTGADRMVGGPGHDTYLVDNEGDVIEESASEGTDLAFSSVSYLLSANVEELTLTGAADINATGNGLSNIVYGNSGANILDGGGGADQMGGGPGNDIYIVDAGDTVHEASDAGTDEVRTALAAITLGANFENLRGTSESGQTLTGNDVANVISGGTGNDVIDGGAGADQLAGGLGNDIYIVDAVDSITEAAGAGTDEVRTALAAYTLGLNLEALRGTSASGQALTGNALANAITGAGGNDVIDGAAGADLLAGGLGDDIYVVDSGDSVTEDAAGGTDEVRTLLAAYTLGANLETLAGLASSGQTLTGNGVANVISGGTGNDVIDGGGGADQLAGGLGNDLYLVDAGDSVTEAAGAGTDEVRTALAAYTLTASVEKLTGLAGTGQALTGNGLANLVTGGAGNDVLDGAAGADQLAGGLGNDVYVVDLGDTVTEVAGAGTDEVRTALAAYTLTADLERLTGTSATGQALTGNGLANIVTGGGGNDVLDGAAGADQLAGGLGNDVYVVDAGDTVSEAAGAGTDEVRTAIAAYTLGADLERLTGTSATGQALTGNGLANVINGGGGNDILDGGAGGADQLIGGLGDDLYFIGGGDSVAEAANAGTDEVRTTIADTTAPANVEKLTGLLDIAQTLRGNGLDNVIAGGAGADRMVGGLGNDVYLVGAGDNVIEKVGEGVDEVRTALAAYTLTAEVENLTGISATGQALTGNSGSNIVTGGSGDDVLRMNGGGNDTANGGAGNDNIFFIGALTAADIVNGGAGVDTLIVQGPYGSLTLTANITQIENVSILGGNNTSFGEPGTNRYNYVLTTHNANFAAGVQARVNGSALLAGEDFTFDGSAETDASYVVYGGKGRDTLLGGLGNDVFFYAEERFATGDTVNGGAGYDGMFLRGNYTIDFNAPGYTGLFTNIENLTLTSATDERYARGGGTEFDYNLTLSDAIVGAGQELTVSGALLMVTETMILDGSQETDGRLRLFGGKSADTLKGGGQADLIHGALGADILAGGGGADAFRYQAVTESNAPSRDHILDFTPGTDKIELDRIDANAAIGGNQAFAWIGSNAFTGSAGQLRAFQSGAQWIVQGDINGDGFADLVIALTLQGPTPLGAGDFLL